MIVVKIDELTPCLKDSETGDIIETEVIRIKRKSFLSKFNKKNGWYVKWSDLLTETEVYGLVVKGTVDIQGLVAVAPQKDYGAAYVAWMCAAPHNNSLLNEKPKYWGMGGHLFAIAAQKSIDFGFDGVMTGFAANKKLVEHYVNCFGAVHIGALHPYQIVIDENSARKILEVYDYEWTDEEL